MDVSSIAAQGLANAQTNFQQAALKVSGAGQSPSGAAVDSVDLSTAAVGVISAHTQFDANIQMLKIANDMEKQAVNLMG